MKSNHMDFVAPRSLVGWSVDYDTSQANLMASIFCCLLLIQKAQLLVFIMSARIIVLACWLGNLVCKYHGWDGQLKSARDFDNRTLCTAHSELKKIQVETWGPWLLLCTYANT